MKEWILAFAVLGLGGCAALEPKTVSSVEAGDVTHMEFRAGPEDAAEAVRAAIADKKWKLLYSGADLPKENHGFFSNHRMSGASADGAAWQKADQVAMKPAVYLQAKTPTSAFSFGAELFIVVYDRGEGGGTAVSIAASTSQMLEKKKLGTYISELRTSLDQRLD